MYILWQKGYRFVTLEEALADPLYKKHLPEPYKGGFFWDYATGVSKSNPVQPQQMIKALTQLPDLLNLLFLESIGVGELK